ncbi:MAG: CPBP family intramembrane metalloprotease [Candidatus Thorarchaeota archaeon]|nr:CPBP family intramembrane metalloprotease [Candidatus Thorarchaeota archaeon]
MRMRSQRQEMLESKESDYRTMALFFFVSLVVVLLYLLAYQFGIVIFLEDFSGGLLHPTLILNAFLMLTAVYGVLVLKEKFQGKDFGLVTGKLPTAIIVGLITWVTIQIIEGFASYIYTGSIEFDSKWSTDSLGLIGLLIGMLFGTALYEEVGYRGFLLVQFRMKIEDITTNRALQISLSLIASQTLFTLLHVPWKVLNQGWTTAALFDLLFSVFMNGIIYGLLYLRTENLFFVMFVHVFGNAPTSLFNSYLGASNILIMLAIIWAAIWPTLQRWEKEDAKINLLFPEQIEV